MSLKLPKMMPLLVFVVFNGRKVELDEVGVVARDVGPPTSIGESAVADIVGLLAEFREGLRGERCLISIRSRRLLWTYLKLGDGGDPTLPDCDIDCWVSCVDDCGRSISESVRGL